MAQTHQSQLQLLYNDARLATLYQALDELHTAASDGDMHVLTTLTRDEMVGWLRDLVYTAEETIAEIEKEAPKNTASRLRLVK
jgi:hypothetical protein